ncbi:MAG: hypothetical protein FVQ81_06195 [Candidatus Glassbacteria bacterium]|nr:hypothetical protein [Candidatus Glassbacteria bacterium]
MIVSGTFSGEGSLRGKIQRMTTAAVISVALAWLPASAQYDLTVNMTSFTPTHENQLFKLRLVNTSTGQQVAEYELAGIVDGDFSTTFSNILASGVTYNIDAFADFNDNKLYDPPPADHAWRIILAGVTSDTTVTLVHNANWVDIQYPNPGQQPEPADTCDCDLNGDGGADIGDVVEWVARVRDGADDPCLDYNGDDRLGIADLIRLLLDIRAGGCLEE